MAASPANVPSLTTAPAPGAPLANVPLLRLIVPPPPMLNVFPFRNTAALTFRLVPGAAVAVTLSLRIKSAWISWFPASTSTSALPLSASRVIVPLPPKTYGLVALLNSIFLTVTLLFVYTVAGPATNAAPKLTDTSFPPGPISEPQLAPALKSPDPFVPHVHAMHSPALGFEIVFVPPAAAFSTPLQIPPPGTPVVKSCV